MAYEVEGTQTTYEGDLIDVRVERVRMPDGNQAQREVVQHPDSVAIAALDSERHLLLIRQYRVPVRDWLWELPAGLRDRDDEDPLDAARRELAEETGVRADTWRTLVDLYTSPGISTEAVRVYLATDLQDEARLGRARDEEETLERRWLSLPDALREVPAGRITNAHSVAGILAVCGQAAVTSPSTRSPNDPWPDAAAAR